MTKEIQDLARSLRGAEWLSDSLVLSKLKSFSILEVAHRSVKLHAARLAYCCTQIYDDFLDMSVFGKVLY